MDKNAGDRSEHLSVEAIGHKVRTGELSAVDVAREAFRRIGEDRLHAFAYLDPEGATAQAASIDEAVRRGEDPGPLAGVPFGVKDNLECRGMPTRHGSLLLEDAPLESEDSVFVRRLRGAGAIPIGKTTLPEFAMDSGTQSPGWGATRNPWAEELTPGGSSGGSAAAVAADWLPFATGSDIGGSIRSPASFCGLVGLMPSHGRIPSLPADSYNALGPLTRTVRDAALILDIAGGVDPLDRHSVPLESRTPLLDGIESHSLDGLRVGWSDDLGYAVVDPEVLSVARDAAERLCQAAKIPLTPIDFDAGGIYSDWLTIHVFELRARLQAQGVDVLEDDRLAPLTRRFFKEYPFTPVEWAAAKLRHELLATKAARLFEEYDVLLTPTVSCPPFPADGDIPEVIDGRDATQSGAEPFTMLANLAWLPALSVPAGFSHGGLPVGLQMVGPRLREDLILKMARFFESQFPWPLVAPSR